MHPLNLSININSFMLHWTHKALLFSSPSPVQFSFLISKLQLESHMAVQAQYPSNALSPNFNTNRDASNGLEDHGRGIGSVLNNPNIGSRKRDRDTDSAMIKQLQFPISSKIPRTAMMVSDNQEASYHCQNRIVGSVDTTTTSGRFWRPNGEIDVFVGLHNAKLRSDLCKIQAKHYNQLLRLIGDQASKRIMEKDSQLVSLKRMQAKLESRLNQVTNENGFWYAAAMNSEAAVSALKASLDQALAKCQAASSHEADAESCCYGGDDGGNRRQGLMCRVCGEREVSVLLLPCRHLCLCVGCERGTDTCPICYGAKSVGMQVFID